eukprot:GHVH01005621.1.p1 GENE.GHVH01005621.1~~GHVH01005621.1.p1  ORF type:complete len:141 (+),score=34.58 GHVH01005621.1:95-517(+)
MARPIFKQLVKRNAVSVRSKRKHASTKDFKVECDDPVLKKQLQNKMKYDLEKLKKTELKEMKEKEAELVEEQNLIRKKKRKNEIKKFQKNKERKIMNGQFQIIKDVNPARMKKWNKKFRSNLQKMSPEMQRHFCGYKSGI